MKLRVGKRAQRQADRIEEWWVKNRPAAPSLFTDELEELFEHIRSTTAAGVRWPTSGLGSLKPLHEALPELAKIDPATAAPKVQLSMNCRSDEADDDPPPERIIH